LDGPWYEGVGLAFVFPGFLHDWLEGSYGLRLCRRLVNPATRHAFEEDIDGNGDAVFLADEVAGVDVVRADAGGEWVGKLLVFSVQ
jgi:hypothetical protein